VGGKVNIETLALDDIIIKGKGKIECDYPNKHKNHIDFLRRLYEDKISRRYQERL